MKKYLISLGVLALMMFSSCEKKATYLSSDKADIKAGVVGSSDTIRLHSDGTKFKVESSPDWVKTTISDSTLFITVDKNSTKLDRKGEITVSAGDITLPMTITQFSQATYLNVPQEKEIKIGKEGGSQSIKIESDGEVEIQDFEGVESSYNNGVLEIKAPKNDGPLKKGKIKLTADSLSQEIEVTLDGLICTVCNGTGYIKCKVCGGKGQLWKEHPYEGIYGCSACGGRGYSYRGVLSEDWRTGKGKSTCSTCKGKGF